MGRDEEQALEEIRKIQGKRYMCTVHRRCPIDNSLICCVNCPKILEDCLINCEEADHWLICDGPCPHAREV